MDFHYNRNVPLLMSVFSLKKNLVHKKIYSIVYTIWHIGRLAGMRSNKVDNHNKFISSHPSWNVVEQSRYLSPDTMVLKKELYWLESFPGRY